MVMSGQCLTPPSSAFCQKSPRSALELSMPVQVQGGY